MKERFWLYQRRRVFYLHDSSTGKRESLGTSNPKEAAKILSAKSEAIENPISSLLIAKAVLSVHDPLTLKRTWADVMKQIASLGKEQTRLRYSRALAGKAFNRIRNKKLLETNSEDLLETIQAGKISTNHFLRRLHNLALGLGWIFQPILPPRLWPKPQFKAKRPVTEEEHQSIINSEKNVERRCYYEILWETGASQSDASVFNSENVDWDSNVLVYSRKKTGETAQLSIGSRLKALIDQLPRSGPWFPRISKLSANDRAAEFFRRCRILKIEGISLHSYRYSWATRGRKYGYPERWAQVALGHNSRAVHHAYAKRSDVVCPPLEDFEKPINSHGPDSYRRKPQL